LWVIFLSAVVGLAGNFRLLIREGWSLGRVAPDGQERGGSRSFRMPEEKIAEVKCPFFVRMSDDKVIDSREGPQRRHYSPPGGECLNVAALPPPYERIDEIPYMVIKEGMGVASAFRTPENFAGFC